MELGDYVDQVDAPREKLWNQFLSSINLFHFVGNYPYYKPALT